MGWNNPGQDQEWQDRWHYEMGWVRQAELASKWAVVGAVSALAGLLLATWWLFLLGDLVWFLSVLWYRHSCKMQHRGL